MPAAIAGAKYSVFLYDPPMLADIMFTSTEMSIVSLLFEAASAPILKFMLSSFMSPALISLAPTPAIAAAAAAAKQAAEMMMRAMAYTLR